MAAADGAVDGCAGVVEGERRLAGMRTRRSFAAVLIYSRTGRTPVVQPTSLGGEHGVVCRCSVAEYRDNLDMKVGCLRLAPLNQPNLTDEGLRAWPEHC